MRWLSVLIWIFMIFFSMVGRGVSVGGDGMGRARASADPVGEPALWAVWVWI